MKNIKTKIACLGLVSVLAVGGVAAFFTDKQEKKNPFTFGNIAITLTEPKWDETVNEGKNHNVTPKQVIDKDPTVTNTADSDAYVFLEVTQPYDNYKIAGQTDTNKSELFSWTTNQGWTEIGNGTDNGDGTMTHIYAYAKDDNTLTKLAAKAKAPTLFDTVKVADLAEGQADKLNGEKDINVVAYAIQTNNIGDDLKPATVWNLVKTQYKK